MFNRIKSRGKGEGGGEMTNAQIRMPKESETRTNDEI
jgi:hypothetical protein